MHAVPSSQPWSLSPSPTTHTLPSTATRANAQRIFRYTRSLGGVIGHELTPSTMTINSAFSPATNTYLWTHGYQPGSIRLIQEMYERAPDVDSFVDELADAGIPIAEGNYIASLIVGLSEVDSLSTLQPSVLTIGYHEVRR